MVWRVCVNCVAALSVSQAVRKVADVLLFGNECVVCEIPANGVCGSCVGKLDAPEVPPLLAVSSSTVLCAYAGVGAEMVSAIKFHNRRQALTPICDALAPSLPQDLDAIVAVPAHAGRRRERGYDVPELMARRLSKRLDVPVIEPLSRIDGGAQHDRTREERGEVEFRSTQNVPERVLLVDDVVTTGATAVACAVSLGLVGARFIHFVALAATPPPVGAFGPASTV